MKAQKEKTKLDTYWNGYCPECELNGIKSRMKLNTNDFYECEKTGLQIVLTFPNFFATILKFRGKGKGKTKPDYAHELPRNEMLCRQISDLVPFLNSELNTDYAQLESSEEIKKYITEEVK